MMSTNQRLKYTPDNPITSDNTTIGIKKDDQCKIQ